MAEKEMMLKNYKKQVEEVDQCEDEEVKAQSKKIRHEQV